MKHHPWVRPVPTGLLALLSPPNFVLLLSTQQQLAHCVFTSKFSCYPSLPCTQMRTLSRSQLCLQHLVPCRRSLDACFQNERVKGLDGWMDGSLKPFPPLSRRIPLALGPRGLLVSLGFAVCRRAPEYFRHT